MSLTILDASKEILTDSLITTHNGFTGGSDEILFYIKNLHSEYYYHNIEVEILMNDLLEGEIFSNSGWSIKIKYGSEQPTEKEWGDILVNSKINLPDLGSNIEPDTSTYHPIWVRIFCPGHTIPQIRKSMKLNIKYFKKLVGENV